MKPVKYPRVLSVKSSNKVYLSVICCSIGYSVSLFIEDEVDPFDPLKTIYDFIQFVDRICVVALQVGQVNARSKCFPDFP